MSNSQKQWPNINLQKYLKGMLQEIIEDGAPIKIDEKAKAAIKDTIKEATESHQENSKQLDTHLIYIAGGALVIVSQIFLADKEIDLILINTLIAGFIFLGLSLAFIAASFLPAAECYVCGRNILDETENFDKRIILLYEIAKEQDANVELHKYILGQIHELTNPKLLAAYKRAEKLWEEIKWNGRRSDFFAMSTTIINRSAYVTFFLGFFFFIIFGVVNMAALSKLPTSSPANTESQNEPI